jgi:histidyl-tRNA synthetase
MAVGERPAQGRFREFLQADIDIVDRDNLAPHYDAEFPLIIADVLGGLPLPPIRVQVNNRKVLKGFYRGLGILEPDEAIRVVDKLDKIGPAGVTAELAGFGVTDSQAKLALALAEISTSDTSFVDEVRKLGVTDPLLDEGLQELAVVIEAAAEHAPGLCFAELKIARGLDYYTGTVYETKLVGFEQAGSVCGGGRYDNLASSGNDRFPGVGISLGISRILGLLFGRNALTASRSVPTCVLVALPAEQDRQEANRIAATLRAKGIPTEVSPSAAKFGKQIKFAERRGIPFVWFPQTSEVKDIRSGDQVEADPAEWAPPPEDLHPTISGTFD